MSAWYPFPSQEAVEKEFQTSFVKLDNMLHDYYVTNKENEAFVNQVRSHIFCMVRGFTNLETLAQTVHQENLKFEAKLVSMKHDVAEGKKDIAVLEKEVEVRLAQLHEATSGNMLRFDNLAEQQRMLVEREAWLHAQLEEANKDNNDLHQDLVAAMKDLGGCKVTIKYMDKEIIGRIQQLQLMQQGLDRHPNTLTWNTIEAEISLNRHKAVIYAHSMRKKGGIQRCPYRKGVVRTVLLQRGPDGLGLSITGGADHRAPVIISAVHPGKPADRFGGLYVGDAILECNSLDLRTMSHGDAVNLLSSCGDELIMKVAHIAGYDDEHHLEKAPILEIDPIPEDRPKSQSLQKYQVGKFPRENTLGQRSNQLNGNSLQTKGPPVLDNVLTTKNSVKLINANSIGNMSATSITEPCRPLEYYYNGEKSEDKNNCFQAKVAVPSSFTAESETGEKVDLSDTIVTGTMAMDIKDDIISYTATPGDIVSEVGRSPAGVENGTGNELGEVETENETKKGTRKEADMGLQNEEEK